MRTHRPLRETFIALLLGVTPIPWGPFKDPLQRAVREQRKIGNHLMWNGLVTQTFADIQEEGYRLTKDKKELTGGRWIKTVFREIFSFLELLFQARNDRLHKNDDTNNEIKP